MKNLAKLLADNRSAPMRRFEVRAAAEADATDVFIYDAIVDDAATAEWFGGVAPEPFVKALRDIGTGTINLRINSPGGSVFGARAIEQALREHPARVVAHIDGLAASAATFIAMAADEVVMNKGALFMIHKAWTVAWGNENDLLATAELLRKIDGTLVQTYVDRTGQGADQVAAWMAAETWFTAQEAVDAGFADSIADAAPKASASWNLSAYAKAPAMPKPGPQPEHAKADAGALLRRLDMAACLP